MIFPLSDVLISFQGPDSKALRAAFTAASISALSPSAALAITSPVAGFSTSKVLPDFASSHLPLINNCFFAGTQDLAGVLSSATSANAINTS